MIGSQKFKLYMNSTPGSFVCTGGTEFQYEGKQITFKNKVNLMGGNNFTVKSKETTFPSSLKSIVLSQQ